VSINFHSDGAKAAGRERENGFNQTLC